MFRSAFHAPAWSGQFKAQSFDETPLAGTVD